MKKKLTEEQIVQKVCKILGLPYSHYNNHMNSADYFGQGELHAKVKIVVYGEEYGRYMFAILEDMYIHTENRDLAETVLRISNILKEHDPKTSKVSKKQVQEAKDTVKQIKEQIAKYLKAEKWLKANNCQKVINNPRKKILI